MHLIPFVLHALISFALEKPIKLANKYLRRWAYTGQRVGKNWTGYFNFEGLSGQEKITIKQFGTLIEGSISTDINDGEYQLELNLTGELFNEEYLMAIYM